MSKFNLKTYQKISGDEHIEMRLREQHEPEKDEINEGQLEDYREPEEDTLIEDLLRRRREKAKVSEATEIVEKQLDNDKAQFDIKLRNSEAYTGDMNKVEEQRLKNDPVEDEKYEDSSAYPKKLRWWEDKPKSPDGLKLASSDKDPSEMKTLRRKAQVKEMEFGDDFTLPGADWGEGVSDEGMGIDLDFEEDFDINDEGDISSSPMVITKENILPPPVAGLFLQLDYDPGSLDPDEAIQEAYDKVMEEKPELAGLLSIDNFKNQGAGVVTVRAVGPEFENLTGGDEVAEEIDFDEVSFDEQDIDGTPMAMGVVKVNTPVTDVNKDAIIEQSVQFINSQHPNLNVSTDALDINRLINNGEIGYIVSGTPEEAIETPPIPEDAKAQFRGDFPIEEVASSDKEVKTAVKKK
jgi:hypothetical protein